MASLTRDDLLAAAYHPRQLMGSVPGNTGTVSYDQHGCRGIRAE